MLTLIKSINQSINRSINGVNQSINGINQSNQSINEINQSIESINGINQVNQSINRINQSINRSMESINQSNQLSNFDSRFIKNICKIIFYKFFENAIIPWMNWDIPWCRFFSVTDQIDHETIWIFAKYKLKFFFCGRTRSGSGWPMSISTEMHELEYSTVP